MRSLLLLIIFLCAGGGLKAQTQMAEAPDSLAVPTMSNPYPTVKKRPWRAAAETFGLNVGVWAFDRFVMQEDFAKDSLKPRKE